MKILHLIDHMGLGGAQNLVLDLVEVLSSSSEVQVWSLSKRILPLAAKRLESSSVQYLGLDLSKSNPFGLFKLRSLLTKEKPDLLHTHLQLSSTFGIAVALSLGKCRPVLVDHVHNDPFQHYNFWQRLCCWIFAPQVDAQVTPSESLRAAANLAFGSRACRMEVIPPGINLRIFDGARTNSDLIRHFRRGASRVVGTAGRLSGQKAVHILLEATPRLLKEDPATRVLIVGDGPLRRDLERQAERLNISRAVTFTGYQADLVAAYQAMDVFVLPSKHEGFGIVLLEAMALGVPVIATRVVGVVDAVQNDVTGLLIPFGDPVALSFTILRIFSEPDLRKRLIDNAAKFVRQYCSRELMAAKIESLYWELLKHN